MQNAVVIIKLPSLLLFILGIKRAELLLFILGIKRAELLVPSCY